MRPQLPTARRPFVAVASGKAAPAQQRASQKPEQTAQRLLTAGKSALVLLATPAAAFADELQQAADQVGRTALSASQVPQWSQVQIPNVSAPTELVNAIGGSGDVNPLLLLGAVAAIAVPTLLYQGLNPGSKVKSSQPANVLQALQEDPRTLLVDIRAAQSVKDQGSPDLASTRKRVVTSPYTRLAKQGEEVTVDGWGTKFTKLAAVKSDSIVILLDSDGKSAPKAAAEISGVEDLYYVAGGAANWQASGQPWKQPGRGFLDFSGLSLPNIAGTLKIKAGGKGKAGGGSGGGGGVSLPELPTDVNTVLIGAGAVLGGLLLFTQTSLVLELVGLGAAGQLAYKNLFYAKDRERTVGKVKTLLEEQIDLDKVPDDLKRLAGTFLETGEAAADELQEDFSTGTGRVKTRARQAATDAKKALQQTASKAEDAAESTASSAKSTANDVGKQAKSAANDVGKKVESAADNAPESVDKAAEEAAESADVSAAEAKDWIESWKARQ